MTSNVTSLTQLEDNLLKELSSSKGNILDNESLIGTLQQISHNAAKIKLKIKECNQTKESIETARNCYKKVSMRGATLYFSSSGLSSIDKMYEFSLSSFIDQFHSALADAQGNKELSIRIINLVESCTLRLYKVTCLGVFEQHRMAYAFNLACMIMKEEEGNGFDSNMMTYFVKGSLSLGSSSKPESLIWVSTFSWNLLSSIAEHNKNFLFLKEHMIHDLQFKTWIQSNVPETCEPPLLNGTAFTNIEKLCIFRIFRPDRCYDATKLFILDTIGEKYLKAPSLNYREVFNQSTSTTPIIFILSKGADPQSNIQKLGEQLGFQSPQRLSFISLGQGQAPLAHRRLEAAFIRGHWIMIQNCHLLLSWVNDLETILNDLGTPHSDFRLWLTTEPSSGFPIGLLQKCFRVVIEPPDSMRLNMQSTLNNMDPVVLDDSPHPAFHVLLYCLTFLHAVLQERKKYGKLGWNISYDFNESDFTISRQLMSTYLSKAWADGRTDIPWSSLKYLIGDAMYGGRVSDDMDRRILQTYFDEYFGDFLFSEGQTFRFSHLGDAYIIPQLEKGLLEEFHNHVETLPLITKPGVLGLHEQADLKFFNDRIEDVWWTLSRLQVNSIDKEICQSGDIDIMSKVADIIKIIPFIKPGIGCFEVNVLKEKLVSQSSNKSLSPCNVALLQELEAFNKLCQCMKVSLNSLLKALNGEIIMTDQLEELEKSLQEGILPEMWAKFAPTTTMKLTTWLSHFTMRHEQYVQWIQSGQLKVLWLSGLHFPQCYLSALLQTACRKNGWALDNTHLHTEVTAYTADCSDLTSTDCDETYISGLYLEGASWDLEKSQLTRQWSKNLLVELPIMKLVPIQKKSFESQQSLFRIPVYLTPSRRNASGEGLVFEAFLDTDIHHSFWILQSVAILMNLE
jgi:dynein heavy chain